MLDAKLGYGRLHAGHELIKWRPIYDAVDMCVGGKGGQQTDEMEMCEGREANSLEGVSAVHACQPADRVAHLMDDYVAN